MKPGVDRNLQYFDSILRGGISLNYKMTRKDPPTDEKKSDVFTSNDFNSRTQLNGTDILEEEYNPFDHRPVEHATTTSGALAHLLKASLGTGILAMPVAFKNAGILFGFIGTIIVGIICTHCVHILVKTSQNLCRLIKTPSLGFSETAEKACEYGPPKIRRFAKFAKLFVEIAISSTYYGAACVYIVFISNSIQSVVEYWTHIGWNIRIYIAIVTIPITCISQIRQLKILVPFSVASNTFVVITFSITLYYMFSSKLEISDKPLMAQIDDLPFFFSTAIFAMEGIGTVMPVENSMKKPQHFLGCPGVLNAAMITVVTMYALIGMFGYVRYGDTVQGSITLNLAEGEILADIAKISMGLSLICTFGLQVFLPMRIIWGKINPMIKEKNHNVAEYIFRTIICIMLGCIAAAVPTLEPFIGLVGAVFFSTLGLLIPTFVETVFLWPGQLGKGNWILWKNIAIASMGLFALITGATVSMTEIIRLYQ